MSNATAAGIFVAVSLVVIVAAVLLCAPTYVDDRQERPVEGIANGQDQRP